MNRPFLLIIAMAISYAVVFSQGCLPEGITFTTQEQIDNFQANYPGCTEIGNNVKIQGANITNLNGLAILTSITGHLFIFGNPSLVSLEGLNSLTSISGGLYIGTASGDNPLITDLSGLNSLSIIGGNLGIGHNSGLQNLDGITSLISIGEGISIRFNDNLTNIHALTNLQSFGGTYLTILANYELPSLNGLGAISEVFDLYILGNNNLTDLSGLEGLTTISGNLEITENNLLTSLTGLGNVSIIEGRITIEDNPSLQNISALQSVSSVVVQIGILNNDALINLKGLGGITEIEGGVYIRNNNSLVSLCGLENINLNTIDNLYITNNDSLSTCDVQSICEYLVSPNGPIIIYDNAPGCNSQAEVEAACLTSLEENIINDEITLFPNPATTFITIHIKEGIAIEEVIIYNHLGQKALVAVPVNNTVDVSGLKKGMFIIEITTNEGKYRKKLVID